jgi:hypothetical protein
VSRRLYALTEEQVDLLKAAIDSYEYHEAPEHAVRNSGYIVDPTLLPNYDEDEPLSDEDQEVVDFLEPVQATEAALVPVDVKLTLKWAIAECESLALDSARDRRTLLATLCKALGVSS